MEHVPGRMEQLLLEKTGTRNFAQAVAFYDLCLRKIFSRLSPTLGEEVVKKVLDSSTLKTGVRHPELESLKISARGVGVLPDKLSNMDKKRIKAALAALLAGVFPIVESLCGKVLTEPLEAEIAALDAGKPGEKRD